MKKKSNNQYLDSIDWEKFLDREMEFFIADLFSDVHYSEVKRVTGFGFENRLTYFKKGVGTWYFSKSEKIKCKEHFAKLILDKDSSIDMWIEKEKETHGLVKSISSIEDIEENIRIFLDIMLYNTEIPFRLLDALEEIQGFAELRRKLEKIRLKALWPEIMENVFSKIFREVSKRYDMSEEQVSFLRPVELIALLKDGKMVSKEELEKRNKGVYFYYNKDELSILYSAEDKLQKIDKNLQECSGVPAFKGNAKGTVKIVNTIKQMEKFENGDILVSINTSPSLMPAIQRASAIVSDEGGITSHAAIVSRELKIPCIVGTQVATKVFKDGDIVEVDADKGIVKIIKRS